MTAAWADRMRSEFPTRSRRTLGASVFRRAPVDPADEKHIDSWNRAAIKKPARRPVEVEIKRAENKKHYQKASW